MFKFTAAVTIALAIATPSLAQTYGTYGANPYRPDPYTGSGGGQFGSSSNSPGLYSNDGQFRGNLNSNQFDPNSVANPFGRYGSQFSPDSINNQFGAGSQFHPDSPTNQFGNGLKVCGVYGCD
ncbi:hypothetical protein VQ045_12485 [Aurantimonas sp. E1-2-R+4]|uniref:hypothetical protein n=1 Tax=Aurantimonas sp. E1-2-R+4 TaxID=3113714 RepID=UPI002F932570